MGFIKDVVHVVKRKRNPIGFWRAEGAIIGESCDINSSVHIISEPYLVSIGNHVRLSANVQIITHDGGVWVCRDLYDMSNIDLFGRVVIGDNVHIGTNAIIMPGVRIGNNCIIGCGAIVTKDIPDNSVAVGVPAKVIKSIEEYTENNTKHFLNTKNMSYDEKKDYLLSKEL